jgi:hypothetical protein
MALDGRPFGRLDDLVRRGPKPLTQIGLEAVDRHRADVPVQALGRRISFSSTSIPQGRWASTCQWIGASVFSRSDRKQLQSSPFTVSRCGFSHSEKTAPASRRHHLYPFLLPPSLGTADSGFQKEAAGFGVPSISRVTRSGRRQADKLSHQTLGEDPAGSAHYFNGATY